MHYILYDERTYNTLPEIEYGAGFTLSFKKGHFLYIDSGKARVSFSTVIVSGNKFHIDESLVFKNSIRAEIVFLKLKIEELQQSSYDFFCPLSFQKYVDKFNELTKKYPEYTI